MRSCSRPGRAGRGRSRGREARAASRRRPAAKPSACTREQAAAAQDDRSRRGADHRRRHAAPARIGLCRRAPAAPRRRATAGGLAARRPRDDGASGRRCWRSPIRAARTSSSRSASCSIPRCPSIRRRTGRLSAQLGQGERLEQRGFGAGRACRRAAKTLSRRRRQFAALEQQRAANGRGFGRTGAERGRRRASPRAKMLSGCAAGRQPRSDCASPPPSRRADPAPVRPSPRKARRSARRSPISCQPARAVTEGLDAVNASGVRSRGLTLATSPRSAADRARRRHGPLRRAVPRL